MGLLDWLSDSTLRSILLPGLLAGLAVVLASALLSVLVVLKRLSFIGQGVSHSAFGGVGVAAACGMLAAREGGGGGGSWSGAMVVVLAFCIAAALAMAMIGDRRAVREDTAIGILLVASMSLGAVLLSVGVQAGKLRGGGASYESILFGQILSVPVGDAWAAAGASLLAALALWWFRRPLMLWAFDETSAASMGVSVRWARLGLMVLLAVAIVTAMRLVGVVLASALLVLPGAIALRLSERLKRVLVLACISGVVGLLGGVEAAIRLDWPVGATIVLALTGVFAIASVWAGIRSRRIGSS